MKTNTIIGVWVVAILATAHFATAHSGSETVKTSIAPKSNIKTTLLSCPAPTNITLSDVTTTSATLEWTPGAGETEWEVAYGTPEFDPDVTGTIATVTNSPEHTLSGLSLETDYEAYVRAVCGTGNESDWTGPLGFTTLSNLICTGDNWTAHPAAAANNWTSVAYGNGKFVAVARSGINNRVMTSADGVNWTAHPAAEYNSWRSVTYSNGKFVAVASGGTNRVMTSPDGVNWSPQVAAEENSWSSVTYGNGKFVAVATGGTSRVMTSADGVNWTAHASTENNHWSSVTYGNGKFVAVASGGTNRVMTSSDGENWTAHPSPTVSIWTSVTYGNGKFVAVADFGTIRVMTSIDGENWTAHSAAENSHWRSVTYGNGKFVAVAVSGTNRVMTSLDGENWTAQLAAENNNWGSVTYGNGKFVAVSENGTNQVMVSACTLPCNEPTDLVFDNITSNSVDLSWTPGDTETEWQVAYGAPGFDPDTQGTTETVNNDPEFTLEGLDPNTQYEVYVKAVCDESSESGWVGPVSFETAIQPASEWISQTAAAAYQWRGVTYGNGLFVAVANNAQNQGNTTRVMTSLDGENWSLQNTPNSPWVSVAYGNGMFVAVSYGSTKAMSSPDGVNWIARNPGNSTWTSVTYGDGKFVAVAQNGGVRVATSTDGINWSSVSVPALNEWYSVTYGNGLYVAVSRNGTDQIMTSPDGENWTLRSAPEMGDWFSVTYGNGLFVAVGIDPEQSVMTSLDGINWTIRDVPENNRWNSVTFADNTFVAVADNGTNKVMTSSEGINWSPHVAAEENGWYDVTYGGGRFVAVAVTGDHRVMTSGTYTPPPCETPTNINVQEITNTFVEVSWSPGEDEDEWEIAYGNPGFNPENEGISENVLGTPEFTIEELDPLTDYQVFVRAICSEISESNWIGINFTTINCPSQTFWNGTEWSNNPPGSDSKMVIEGNFNISTAIEVCDIEINSGTLTIHPEASITINGVLINNTSAENFVVSENAHIIQTSNEANTGEITVLRNSTPMYQLDATFWSSPVSGQNLKDFSPGTLNGRFWIFDAFADAYVGAQPLDNDFVPGVGYVIQAPNDYPASDSGDSPLVFEGVFKGVPHNGNYSIATAAGNYNLIGNPYPSAIEAQSLINAHGADIGTFYFWTHQSHPDPVEETYPYSNYATWTTMGGAAAEADDYTGDDPAPVPNGIIPPGQGFYIYTEGTEVTFTNAMRTTDEGHFYFYEPERHRYWLNLYSEQQAHNQILVGYMEGATNGFDYQIDGEMMNYNGNAIYTFLNNPDGQTPEGQIKKLVVQGRSLGFNAIDVVPLGFNAVHSGQFVISLSQGDGIFTQNGQQVYLRDSRLNTITNISESPYSFYSASGEYNDRFELVYQTDEDLGVSNENLNNVLIYGYNYKVFITSDNETITDIVIYDILGRKLFIENQLFTNSKTINTENYGNQIIFIKVTLSNGILHTKKIINR